MNKRGELTSTQIVTIILSIIGFVLAGLGLYTIFEDDSLTNRDLCRLSILSRATVPTAGQQFVPLNCQTEKICITVDSKDNSCKQFAGEKNIRKVELKISEKEIKNAEAVKTIQKEVANAMYGCWLMTGKGKLDIFPPGEGTSTPAADFLMQLGASVDLLSIKVNPSCIVCSRVAFSDALIEADKKYHFLKDIDYNNFLSTQTVPGTNQNYLDAFTGQKGTGYGSIAQDETISAYLGKTTLTNEEYEEFKKLIANAKFITTPEQRATYDEIIRTKENTIAYLSKFTKPQGTNQMAIMFAQIKVSADTPQDAFWNAMTTGGVMGSIAAVTGPGSLLSVPAWAVKILTVGGVSTYLAYDAEAKTTANQALSVNTCGVFESTQANQKGCSLVKLMDWNVNEVNSLCYNIEGNL